MCWIGQKICEYEWSDRTSMATPQVVGLVLYPKRVVGEKVASAADVVAML
jgi:hypothetical protein